MRVAPLALAPLAAVAAVASAQQPAAPAANAANGAKRAFALADWYKVTTVGSPAVSPDGKRVAFTVTTVKEAENRRHTEIWIASTSGGEPTRYTSPSTESSAPRWSPDGAWLWFNSSRPGVKGSTYRLRMDAPGGEAEPVDGPLPSSWSHDGRVLV